MESEHTTFSPSQAEPGTTDNSDATHTSVGQNKQSEQETSMAESAQNEAKDASRHRRRRPTRGNARRSRSSATEQSSEEAEHPGEGAEAAGQDETTQVSNEPAQPPAAFTPEIAVWEAWTSTEPAAEAPGGQEPSPPFAPPNAPGEITGDLETASLSSPATTETPLEANEQIMAPTPAQEPPVEAPVASFASEQAGETPREPMRAPLSGVEVRPPRRYRFDRPSPTTRQTPPREVSQAAAQPTAHQEAPASEAPAADKAPGAVSPSDNGLGAAIEREMTETPEIEADVVAAEELARATQAALEEEVAEALESFTASTEQTHAQRSGGRRRRRRPASPANASPSAAADTTEKAQPPAPQPPSPQSQAPQPYVAPVPQGYEIANGLQQIGQPQSPFSGPEPSSARGFGPVPRGVAMPAERSVRMPRPERTVETGNVSANQLAMIFTQAIQQQTDRLLMELRRSQGTPSMTVNFPPMPSTERIGVFVDVANLLYSARNMRIAIDFGRLLDFLRGNRRLVRAHAYCPTSPDPRAEQMFLDAVKGLGYRITTKNYKTFSSGAKKADLDLDLCMDIVRLVDAGSVDCISLVSGDSDFLPLLEYCSDHGVRVEVAAFDEATASILRQSCDLFINLSMVEEIRA